MCITGKMVIVDCSKSKVKESGNWVQALANVASAISGEFLNYKSRVRTRGR